MAPAIIHRRAESTALKAGLISVAVVAGVTLAALLVYLALFRMRNRQYEEACKRDPYLTRKEFARRRKLSSLQRIEEEEAQRQLILRKTLTSRASSRNVSEGSFLTRDAPDSLDEHPALRQQHQPQEQQQEEEEGLERDQSDDEDQELMADREREWKRLEAGLEAPEINVCENSPLIEEHPAMQEPEEDDVQRRRSNSSVRAPLLSASSEEPQDPESQRTSLWDRRLSDNSTASFCRTPSASPPPMSSVTSTPRPARAHPYIVPPPAQLLHLSSPGQPKAINIRHTPTLVMVPSPRPRAASLDTRQDSSSRHRSPSNASLYSSPPSNPPTGPLPTAPRTRSSSNASIYSNPLSDPPTGPLPPIPTPGYRSRSSSTASSQAPFPNLISPPPPAALPQSPSPKKDGFLSPDFVHPAVMDKQRSRALSWDVDRPNNGHQRARSHEHLMLSPTYRIRTPSPSVSPRRKPVPQRANSAKPLSPVVEPATSTPVIAAPADPLPVEPVGNAGPVDRPLGIQEGAIVEQVIVVPDVARIPSPAISDRDCLPSQAAARRRASGLLQEQSESQVTGHNNGSQPSSMRGRSPPAPIREPIIDPRRFSFEEGSSLKMLSVRSPARKPVPDSPPSPPLEQPQEQQQQEHLPVPRLNRDRTRSVEHEMNSPPRAQLNAEDVEAVSRRLRSRSFEDRMPVARGKWQLQVSILDQTGAPALRSANSLQDLDGDDDSSDDDPEEETIRAEPGPSDMDTDKVRGLTDGTKPPDSVASSSPALSQQTDASSAPSTANTPATPDLPLCRANFASPLREKQLAETPPVTAVKQSPPLFYSPPPGASSPPLFVSPMSPVRASATSPRYVSISPKYSTTSPNPREWHSPEHVWAQHELYQHQYQQQGQQRREPQEYPFHHQRHHSAGHNEQLASPTCVELEYGRDTMKQAVDSPTSPVSANTKLSFRLSGPPDLGPGFLGF